MPIMTIDKIYPRRFFYYFGMYKNCIYYVDNSVFETFSEIHNIICANNLNKTSFIFRFITDSLNALVGLIIFIILVVLRKKVIRGLANRTFLGTCVKFPASWKRARDSECEELEEENIMNMETVVEQTRI